MVTENYWTERAQQAEERRQQRELEQQQQVPQEPSDEIPEAPVDEVPEMTEEPGLTEELQEAPSAVGDGGNEMLAEPMAVAAGTHWKIESAENLAGVQKHSPGKKHLPGASPKRNRQYEHIKEQALSDGKSEDEAKELAARTVNKQRADEGETKDSKTGEALQKQDVTKDTHPDWSNARRPDGVIDTEADGSPHPTERQDIADGPDWDNTDPLKSADAVLEHQDVEKDSGPGPVATGGGGWSTNKGQADPVTSASLTDVERNPITSLMEGEYEGFVPASEVQDAISTYESNS
jgi:hypothetical protein